MCADVRTSRWLVAFVLPRNIQIVIHTLDASARRLQRSQLLTSIVTLKARSAAVVAKSAEMKARNNAFCAEVSVSIDASVHDGGLQEGFKKLSQEFRVLGDTIRESLEGGYKGEWSDLMRGEYTMTCTHRGLVGRCARGYEA